MLLGSNRPTLASGPSSTVHGGAAIAVALPSSQIRWRPNPDRGSASGTLSGGRRGDRQVSCAPDGANLALLVPAHTEGLITTQAEPTVAWHIDASQPVNLELVLSHPEQATPVYTQTLAAAQTKTIQVTLPELTPDVRYRWTVFLSCDTDPAVTLHSRSFIERIDFVPAGLTPELSAIDQAKVYAAAGIWYDAYATLLASDPHAQHSETQNLLQQLLAQANPEHPLVAATQ